MVDDGSKDETFNVAQQFASRTVKVFTQKSGSVDARNIAYSACQGDFIQWLDADDLLGPAKWLARCKPHGSSASKPFLLVGLRLFIGPAKPSLRPARSGMIWFLWNGSAQDGPESAYANVHVAGQPRINEAADLGIRG